MHFLSSNFVLTINIRRFILIYCLLHISYHPCCCWVSLRFCFQVWGLPELSWCWIRGGVILTLMFCFINWLRCLFLSFFCVGVVDSVPNWKLFLSSVSGFLLDWCKLPRGLWLDYSFVVGNWKGLYLLDAMDFNYSLTHAKVVVEGIE